MKLFSKIIFFLFFSISLFAQNKKKISIGVLDFKIPSRNEIEKSQSLNIYGISLNAGDEALQTQLRMKLEAIQSIVTECYVKDSRFSLVDRRTTDAIQKERELQKTEDFMDGYVVSQNKGIGADYLLVGNFDLKTSKLLLTLYSTEEGKMAAKESGELKQGFFGTKNFEEPTLAIVRKLNDRVFPLLMPMVEVKDQSKTKVKQVLIAGGTNRGLKEDMKLDIKIKDEIEVDGEKQTYYKSVGVAVIDKVEDINFTIVRVQEGGEDVKKLLDAGKKVYCTFQNK